MKEHQKVTHEKGFFRTPHKEKVENRNRESDAMP